MLVLLNNRFTIIGGRNTPQAEFDVPVFPRLDMVDVTRSTSPRGIAFAHNHPTETTFSNNGIHAIDLANQSRRESEESKDVGEEIMDLRRYESVV